MIEAVRSRTEENRALKKQYALELGARYPFNTDIHKCASLESGFFLALEEKYMTIPAELSFEVLEKNILPDHRERIGNIWKVLEECRKKWKMTAMALARKWETGFSGDFEEALATEERIADDTKTIRERFSKGIEAICLVDGSPEGQLTPLRKWQEDESGLRYKFYHLDKNYLLALRLYYEMLLEYVSSPGKGFEAVLSVEQPVRTDIFIRNRYLRVIDASHQAATIAKGAHHQQKEKRLRRMEDPVTGERKAYWQHPLEVMGAYILDVVPYILGEKDLKLDLILGVTAAVLHDLGEDTDEPIENIVSSFLASRTDIVDVAISPAVKSGLISDKEKIKEKYLALIGPKMRQWLRSLLRVLAKNTVLRSDEVERALYQNIAGSEKTLKIVQSMPQAESSKNVKIDATKLSEPSKTFTFFPVDGDEKLDCFLVRLNSMIDNPERRQNALIVKIEDRADNLLTLVDAPVKKGKDPLKDKRETFRSTVTRLISWAVLDHDKQAFPLYNALPRLVDVTLREYRRLQETIPVSQRDRQDDFYIAQLQEWSMNPVLVPRHQPPAEVEEIALAYAA